MGIAYNPRIVTDGLVLCLDAANPKSYPGSGTTWTDLSGNGNNGTLVNGASYNSSNGGVIALDGVNDYIDVSINLTNQNYTIMGAARYVTIGGRTFSGKSNNWLMGHWSSTTRNYYAQGWVSSVQNGESDTNWRVYAATGDYSGDSWALYVNGQLNVGPNSGGVTGPNGFAIGSYQGTSEYSNSHISFLICYNRVLTASEIQQNYNALGGRYEKGGINNPFSSPTEARVLGYTSGDYYFQSGSMSSPQLLEFQRDYYEDRGWVCVFRSPYRSTATTNKIDLNIPMAGLLVQRDALDLRAAVYWSTPITYNTVGGSGNNTADSGYSPRRVILGNSGGHGIYATNQNQCSWSNATGAIGAGWDGSTCGSFPNDLVWGTGQSNTATYANRSGTWSHWITWG